MSRITTTLATSHRVSLAAMEEASRVGRRTADCEHMLLALTIDPGIAGEALRQQGVTLHAAREAVAAQHADHLNALGFSPAEISSGPIVFHETGGYEWSEGALAVLKLASSGKNSGDSVAMLRALVHKPSGMVESILERLGTSPAAITAQLDEPASPTVDRNSHSNTSSSGAFTTTTAFVPAPLTEIWELVSNPARIPEWDPSIASVASGTAPMCLGESRTARARVERPDGGRIRIKPEFKRVGIELAESLPPHEVTWRFWYPDSERANTRRVTIRLEESADGTRLRLNYGWERRNSRRSVRGLMLHPLQRVATAMQASQLASSIARAFR